MNKGTYKLTFVVNAESLDMAIDVVHNMSYQEKLDYIYDIPFRYKEKNRKDNWSQEGPLSIFPRGAIAGNCLHRILEKLNYQIPLLFH